MKKLVALLLSLVMVLSMVGCTKAPQAAAPAEAPAVVLPTKDMAGYDIVIPENITSIISMAPSITQILVDLGLGDKIIAIDKYSVGLLGVKADLPVFDIMAPDAEQLVNLKPDVIFASGMSQADGQDPFKPVKDVGICMIYIPSSDSIDAIKKDIQFVADATQTSDKGKALITAMEAEIEKISAIGKTIPDADKKSVYFEISAAPYIYSFGKNVFLNEMIELIGAKNAFGDQESWVSLTEEAVIQANPDVILTNIDYIDNPVEEIKARKGWADMRAIQEGNVFAIDKNGSSLPNHNITKALWEMGKAVYPDKY